MTNIEYKLIAAEVVGYQPPIYDSIPLGGTYSGKEVSWKDLHDLLTRLNSARLCLPPILNLEVHGQAIHDQVVTLLNGMSINDAEVNDSRPTGDPEVWKKAVGEFYIHPVISRTGPITLAYHQPQKTMWTYAFVMLYPSNITCVR